MAVPSALTGTWGLIFPNNGSITRIRFYLPEFGRQKSDESDMEEENPRRLGSKNLKSCENL